MVRRKSASRRRPSSSRNSCSVAGSSAVSSSSKANIGGGGGGGGGGGDETDTSGTERLAKGSFPQKSGTATTGGAGRQASHGTSAWKSPGAGEKKDTRMAVMPAMRRASSAMVQAGTKNGAKGERRKKRMKKLKAGAESAK